MGVLILVVFAVLLVLAVPIAFLIGGTGAIGILATPGGIDELPVIPQQIFASVNSFSLLTVPLFIFAGTIMAQGGVANRLMKFAQGTVGRGKGGLGVAIVVSALFFHGISGSSTADTAAIGRVTLPTLKQQRYPVPFSAALLAAAGATALLIPPSIDLIIVGLVANISIAGLFAGGIIPAIINALGLIVWVIYQARRHNYGGDTKPVSVAEMSGDFVKAIPGLFMIVIILGGILGGIFTPTEASVVAVVYGLFIAMFVYRDLKVSMLVKVFRTSIELCGVVMLIIAMGGVLSYAFTINQVPVELSAWIQQVAHNKFVFLLMVQILFFIIGMIMDGVPAEIILMPILTPIAISYGIQPIHFGILVVANVGLGLAHPPVGLCLNTACAVAKIPLERAIRPLLPFIAIQWVTLLIITYAEGFTMFLPKVLNLVK
jgi:tripartite ATP-independent transporter DctM subunit